jgi:hypothetical protein
MLEKPGLTESALESYVALDKENGLDPLELFKVKLTREVAPTK